MVGTFHKDMAGPYLHAVANWVYADATARVAATGFLAGDIGKLAWQQSDHTLWMLTAVTPTWVQHSYRVGTAAGTVAAGDDGRMTNARTPTAHATTHKSGGTDAIRLDELAAPTADVALGAHKLTGVADPTASQDAATKIYVDALMQGIRWKAPARAASTANVSLTAPGAAVDGVTLASGDRLLLKDQTAAADNGLYVWTGAAAALTRATDADTAAEVLQAAVFVMEGTVNADKFFVNTTNAPVTLGTTALAFVLFAAGIGAHHASHEVGGSDALAGIVPGSAFAPTGLTGAVAATRFVGGTASVAPTTGTFALGDFVITQAGSVYICTAGGSPGTWAAVSGGGGGAGSGSGVGTLQRVAQVVVAADQASVVVGSIPQIGERLIVKASVRTTRAGQNADALIAQPNGDTAAGHYTFQEVAFDLASGPTRFTSNHVTPGAPINTTAATSNASAFGAGELCIESYARTDRWKPFYGPSHRPESSTDVYGGQWEQTAAITSLTFISSNGANIKAGTVIEVFIEGGTAGPTVSSAAVPTSSILGTATLVANTSIAVSTTYADVLTITVTLPTVDPIVLSVDGGWDWNSVPGDPRADFQLYDATAGVEVGRHSYAPADGNNSTLVAYDTLVTPPAPGVRVYKLRVGALTGTGSIRILATATGPARLTARATVVQTAGINTLALGGLVPLYDYTLPADAATIAYTPPASGYRDLVLSVVGRGDRAGQPAQTIGLRLNGDSGANYDAVIRYFDAAGGSSSNAEVGVARAQIGYLAAATATANSAGQIEVELPNYLGTTYRKTWSSVGFANMADASTVAAGVETHGEWRNPAAITQVDLMCIDGTVFKAGTRITVWGRSAAITQVAAGGALSETRLAAAAATITVPIPAGFKDLEVEVAMIDGGVGTGAVYDFLATVNGDAGANYDYIRMRGRTAAAAAIEGFGANAWIIGDASVASQVGRAQVRLVDYENTTAHKAIRATTSYKEGTASGNVIVSDMAGWWRSTAAITSLTLARGGSGGMFAAGTVVRVYARGGVIVNPGPRGELGSAAITSAFTSTAVATAQDVTGLAVAVTVGTRPIKITVALPLVDTPGAGIATRPTLSLIDVTAGVEVGATYAYVPNGALGGGVTIVARLAPAPGARTYKVQVFPGSTVATRVFCSATEPALLLVEEV